jgi:F420-dependent oxidoreductase-like protein
MRFGAFVPQGWRLDLVGIEPEDQWSAMRSAAAAIEQAGYESGWVYDHFHTVPAPTQEATYEAWTLMAALAASTSTLRLGQMCTCNSYRQPSYLAKVATSIDNISDGRLEMGIGAGWYEHEYRGYGYAFPKPSVRIGQLAEGVEIMRRLWTEDEVSFRGEHYTLDGAICRPRPRQQPHIPLWIAGGGEKLTLRVAAEHADYTNFSPDPEGFAHKSEVLAGHCRDVGRDLEEIVRSANFNVVIAETEQEVADQLAAIRDRLSGHVSAQRVEGAMRGFTSGGGLAGTPEQLVPRFERLRELGLGYAICYFADAASTSASLELFAREVIPALR